MKLLIIYHQETKVYVHGVFDLFHYGHVKLLKEAKSLGDILIVGLVTDANAKKIKGKTVLNYDERLEVISSIKYVDLVVEQQTEDPTENLKLLDINILCRGEDYKGNPPGSDYMEISGGKVVRIPYSREISSTEIKRRILEE